MFAYTRAEMVGQPVELLLPDALRAGHVRQRESYHGNPTTRPMGAGLDLFARRRDGVEFPVEIGLSPLRTDAGMQIVAAVRDVTRRREMETERARLLAVAERARTEAEGALRIAEQAERLKDDLANMMVHDLKNPSTASR
jgi:PAS domain S-box-containing protein